MEAPLQRGGQGFVLWLTSPQPSSCPPPTSQALAVLASWALRFHTSSEAEALRAGLLMDLPGRGPEALAVGRGPGALAVGRGPWPRHCSFVGEAVEGSFWGPGLQGEVRLVLRTDLAQLWEGGGCWGLPLWCIKQVPVPARLPPSSRPPPWCGQQGAGLLTASLSSASSSSACAVSESPCAPPWSRTTGDMLNPRKRVRSSGKHEATA